jgi:ABC-type glycerol-3-phosphate transport system permease component
VIIISYKIKKNVAITLKLIPLLLYTLTVIGSLYFLIVTSLKYKRDYILNKTGIPSVFTLSNFIEVMSKQLFLRWFLNSVIITCFAILIGSIISILMSYGFSRFNFKFRDTFYAFVSSLMVIPPIVLLSSIYEIQAKLNLINTYYGVILVYVGWIVPFWVYFLTKFFSMVDKSIIDSARIDGCTDFRILWNIVLPLSKSSVITLTTASTLWVWGELLIALVFLQRNNLKTLMVGLTSFQGIYVINVPAIFAGLIIATIPMIIFYIFGQRFFIKSVMAGAVKE